MPQHITLPLHTLGTSFEVHMCLSMMRNPVSHTLALHTLGTSFEVHMCLSMVRNPVSHTLVLHTLGTSFEVHMCFSMVRNPASHLDLSAGDESKMPALSRLPSLWQRSKPSFGSRLPGTWKGIGVVGAWRAMCEG